MAYQAVFKRFELKYLLTRAQKETVLAAIAPYMAPDQYGRTTIRNIYFDTDTYRLIRRSIDKPTYKEKLRIRSYQKAEPGTSVFVELKRKYKGLVYKRRLSMPENQAMTWIMGHEGCPQNSQIGREIDYFLRFYEDLHPSVFLSYEREAYYARDGSDFRITFDDHILCRCHDLSLESGIGGTPILDADKVLMEIKCAGGIPLWLTQILSREHLYKTSFSKYGTAYRAFIYPQLKEGTIHAEQHLSGSL